MRKALIILLVLFCTLSARCAEPKGDALFNRVSRTYVLNPDGSFSERVIKELTYLSYNSFHNLYGETFIDYDPEYQELLINSSYTKRPDGETLMTPENAFVEVLPDNAADAPAHNRLRRMVVVHTGLEPGAKAYLDYTIVTKEGYLPELDVAVPLNEKSPVAEFSITISVPDNKELRYSSAAPVVEPLVTSDGIQKTYRWNLKNVPASSSDPGKYDAEVLEATTFESFEEAFSFVSSQFAAPADIDSAVVSAVHTVGADSDRIAAVDRYLTDHIAVVRIPLRYASYRLRPAGEILASAYATPEEYASLRAAMLESQGLSTSIRYREGNRIGIAALDGVAAVASFEQSNTKKVNKYRIELEYGSSQLEDGYLVVSLPYAEGAFDGRPYAAYPSRRTQPLFLDKPVNEEYEYVITLGQGIVASGLSNLEKEISNVAGYYSCRLYKDGNKLIVKRIVEIFQPEINPACFPDFRTVMAEWSAPCTLILKN